MYPSRGGNAYSQQSYSSQSGYAQKLGTAYSGSSVTGTEGGSQLSLASQHSSIRDAIQDTDVGGYRGHSSSTAHYGGQYVTPYVPASLTGSHQAVNAKGAGQSSLENHSGFASTLSDSPKYRSTDYLSSSSHAYGRKSDTLYNEKISDFPSFERRQYAERQGAYIGRDLQTEPTARFSSSSSYGQQNQIDIYDRIDQATLIRREQFLKAQSLQSSSLDGSLRQNEYLAARTAANRHSHMDLAPYGGRMDADPRSSLLGNSPYRGVETTSMLGAAPRRNVDDILYAQGTSNPGYGVSLPPGRDYSAGRHLHGIESDFSTTLLPISGHPRVEESKDDRAGYLREFELREVERRRERSREREREKARERERNREREREREHERERECERERARDLQRLTERRGKGRERERKRVSEARRERTPLRASKDHRASSLSKDVRPLRRDTPRHEATHRRHSPLKQIRREYVCKVYSSSLIALERDYLSIDKRYPRLFVSPELSKVVVHWPKENVKLSLHTAVSFEHDMVVADGSPEIKSCFPEIHVEDHQSERHQETVWNAKVILMSGLSRSALETLSSDKSFDDHVPHICNILRFAVLKRDHALMAIGGPCGSVDGSEPSVDDSVLIQAALRYTKDLTQLDLHKCQQWNRFLEIHYDRIGNDGLFSHKEVTVLFVPDLSDCLPSFEKWKEQWLALKKAVSQREHGKSTKTEEVIDDVFSQQILVVAGLSARTMKEKEMSPFLCAECKKFLLLHDHKSGDKIEGSKDDDLRSSKDMMKADTSERSKDSGSSAEAGKGSSNEKHSVLKESPSEVKFDSNDKKDTDTRVEVGKVIEDKETSDAQTSNVAKPAKKKIVRKIVKQKASDKKAVVSSDKQLNEKPADTTAEEDKIKSEDATVQSEEQLGDSSGVKTFVRKKVVKKVAVAKKFQQQDVPAEVKDQMEVEGNEGEQSGIVGVNAAVVKRKIIKKVPKKKSGTSEAASNSIDKDGEQNVAEVRNSGKEASNVEKKNVEVDKQGQDLKPIQELQPAAPDTNDSSNGSDKAETKGNSKSIAQKDTNSEKNLQRREKLNVDKDKRDTTLCESTWKSDEDLKEKRRLEEPPRPGFVLSTKGSKDHKVRSMSVSLDSLLDYSDKDTEESNFEISLFAESLYEMLQYQMGCRVLEFLRKLRDRFIRKRNLQKRKREETDGGDVKRSPKLMKTSDIPTSDATIKPSTDKTKEGDDIAADTSVHNKNVDDRSNSAEDTKPGNKTAEENGGASACLLRDGENGTDASNPDHVDDTQMLDRLGGEDEEDPDDDPEEDPEENEEAEDVASQPDAPIEEKTDNAGSEHVIGDQAVSAGAEPVAAVQDTMIVESKPNSDAPISDKKDEKVETKTKQSGLKKEDKEVMQAFHFFDRNRAGYIRVEDVRLIIHSLGKFISYRDVKELVQTALLESNIGRDDRIFYNKLVRRMSNT